MICGCIKLKRYLQGNERKKKLRKTTNGKFAGQVPNTWHDLLHENFEKEADNNNAYITVLI